MESKPFMGILAIGGDDDGEVMSAQAADMLKIGVVASLEGPFSASEKMRFVV